MPQDLQGTPGSHYLQNIPSSQESHDLQEKSSSPQAPNDLQETHAVVAAAGAAAVGAAAVGAAAVGAAAVAAAAEELEAAGAVAAEESIATAAVAAAVQLDAAAAPS